MGSCQSGNDPVSVKDTVSTINRTGSFEKDRKAVTMIAPVARAGSGSLDVKGDPIVGNSGVAALQKQVQDRLQVSSTNPVDSHVYVTVDESSLAVNFSR